MECALFGDCPVRSFSSLLSPMATSLVVDTVMRCPFDFTDVPNSRILRRLGLPLDLARRRSGSDCWSGLDENLHQLFSSRLGDHSLINSCVESFAAFLPPLVGHAGFLRN